MQFGGRSSSALVRFTWTFKNFCQYSDTSRRVETDSATEVQVVGQPILFNQSLS